MTINNREVGCSELPIAAAAFHAVAMHVFHRTK